MTGTGESRADEARKCRQKLRALTGKVNRDSLGIGRELKQVRDRELYKELGCEIFEDLLDLPYVSLKPSKASRLIERCEDSIGPPAPTQADGEDIDGTKPH